MYPRVQYNHEKGRITTQKLDTSYDPCVDYSKALEFDAPVGDYISINYFGEKYDLKSYRQRYKLETGDDIEPLGTDQVLPPRPNDGSVQPEVDPSFYTLSLLGNNKNPFMINYKWY